MIIAKTAVYAVFCAMLSLISLIIVEFLFAVPFTGLFADIFIILFLTSFSGACAGILFSVISRTRLQAAQLFLLAFVMFLLFMIKVRIPAILVFVSPEQGAKAIVNVAYRGFAIFDTPTEIINLAIASVVFFCLSVIIFTFFRKELV